MEKCKEDIVVADDMLPFSSVGFYYLGVAVMSLKLFALWIVNIMAMLLHGHSSGMGRNYRVKVVMKELCYR
jgi:hypothetical protein